MLRIRIQGNFAAPPRDAQINLAAVNDYLTYRYTPGVHTLVTQIVKLLPGTVLEYDFRTNELKTVPYFDRKSAGHGPSSAELFDLIQQAIQRKRRRRCERPASLLSGGIDSSLVSDLLQNSIPSLETYTLSFSSSDMDESERAKAISRSIEVPNTTIPNTNYSWERLEELVYHLDDPYGDPIIIALDKIFSFIQGRHRVVVTGEGSDEIFSGYVHHRIMAALEKVPGWAGFGAAALIDHLPREILRWLFPYSARLRSSDYTEAVRRMGNHLKDRTLPSFLQIFSVFDRSTLKRPEDTSLNDWGNYENSIKGLRNWDVDHWLCDSQLFKLDKISMASSIEAREPFVDQDLVLAVDRLDPKTYIFRMREDKPALRDAVHGRLRIPRGTHFAGERALSFNLLRIQL